MKSKLLILIAILTLFAIPKLSFGQINLGAAANFVIYTTGGSVHDNPTAHSNITGDVGYFTSGDFLGFGNIDGTMHPGVDPATTACQPALLSAVAQINTTSNDYFPGLLLGNGVTFTPGVYSIPGNATMTLDLILDAQSVPTAEFIIKINGSFSTGSGAKVKLINGAQACHVYWLIEGQVNMATNTTMRGNVIANNALINMGSGDTIEGRLFSTTGAITIDGITARKPIGCGSPVLTGPTLPPMGSLACYTIFSSIGALNGNLSSTSIGDVGNAGGGTVTGWTAGNVTGTLHPTGDPSTMLAAIDLQKLYDTLNAMIPDIELLYPAEFGRNLVLTPHVYVMNSAAIFTDSVTLDAQGNANAVFVIKVLGAASSISSSVNSKVRLINGAQAQNVFWVINGAVTINDNSTFRGNIVVPAGAINLWYSGVVLEGRALTINGAITTAGLAAIMPPGCVVLACDPVIITEPISQTACIGDSISFIVSATGTGLTYQWRIGSVDIIGATSDTLTINPVTLADAALDYNVIVYGACLPNDTSINASLTIDSATTILTQPLDQAVCLGDSVSFVVVATGGNPTYQWQYGNIDILGATNDTLTINPVTLLDTVSDYTVIVTGSCGSDTSLGASITIDSVINIITQPMNQIVCVGDSASFTVIATGSGLTYQWYNGLIPLVNGGNISGADSATLIINPVGFSDTSSYYNVVISGSCGSNDTSVYVSLEANSAPIIITQPISQTVCAGDSVSFVVVASGSGLTYQWRKGLVPLVNGGNISGADSDTLTINPATVSDIGSNYNVVVSGVCIALDSVSAGLSTADGFGILAGTAITSTGFTEIHDLDVGLSPGVHSSIVGFPPAIVVNGAIYASDDVAPPGVAAMLIQAKQDLTDAYLFAEGATAPAPAIIAGDQGGKTLTPGIYKTTSTLLIQSGDLTLDAQGDINAKWIFQIASGFTTIGGAGGNVILTGGAQANNITWQVGSSATIGNSTSFAGNILALTSITMNTGSSIDGRLLAINGAVVMSGANMINTPSDSVSTVVSQSISVNVSLMVDTGVNIITQPVSQVVCVGDSVSLFVVATGSNLSYQWNIGSVPIIGATNDTLTINPVALTDAAMNYNVIITGSCSIDTSINVFINVNPATIITTQPVSQMACVGDSVAFFVTATGTNLTYQWNIGIVPILGATNDTLIINPVTLLNAAMNYNVVITSSCGSDTSNYVSLTVGTVPVITLEPISQTICENDSTGFSVIALGTGLTYQWYIGTDSVIGATSSTLIFDPALISDTASNYNVIVSGSCGSDTSVYVSLTVTPAPIAIASSNSPICSGDSIMLNAQTVTGGTYLWAGPNAYASTDQYPVILSAQTTDAGTYSLIITLNGCSSVPAFITVVVNDCSVDLAVVKTVDYNTPLVGQTVVFTIVATNNGPATATGVMVTDLLQNGYTYVSSTTTQGTYDPATGIWNVGTLNSGVSAIMTVSVTVNSSGVYVNTATISGLEEDLNSINDVSVIETYPTDFFIPDGFSPNGDGINDLFVIRGIFNFPANSIVIFNRWGAKVFESSPYQNTWDGNATNGLVIGGGDVPVGTYFYLLDLGNETDVIKGTIYLNR